MKLKKGQINQVMFMMVDATDFATPEARGAASVAVGLYGVDQGASAAASTITVTNAVTSVTTDKIYRLVLQADECGMDHYMLRLSCTGCATQFIPLEMDDVSNSDIWSFLSNVDSAVTSQFNAISDAVSNVQSTLDSHIVIASDFMSNIESRVPKEVASKSLLSDVESNVRSQFTALSNDISNVQSTLDSHIVIASDFMSNVLSRVPKEVASKSLLSDVESNVRSQFAGLSNDVSNAQSVLTAASHLSNIGSAVWAQQYSGHSAAGSFGSLASDIYSKAGGGLVPSDLSDIASAVWAQIVASHLIAGSFGSKFSDIHSRAGGGAGLSVSDIASGVWAEHYRVHSTASSFGSAFSNLWTAANAARDNASNAHSMTQYLSDAVSNVQSTIDSHIVIASDFMSNMESRVPKEVASKSLLSDVESNVRSQLTYLSDAVSNVQSTLDSHIVIASNFMSNMESRVPKEVASKSLVSDVESNLRSQASDLDSTIASRVNAEVVDVLRTDTIPDSYSTDGAQPTIAQAILAIHQFLQERAVAGTTVTVKKPDGTTTAQTFTLDDGTTPTSITRAT